MGAGSSPIKKGSFLLRWGSVFGEEGGEIEGGEKEGRKLSNKPYKLAS